MARGVSLSPLGLPWAAAGPAMVGLPSDCCVRKAPVRRGKVTRRGVS